MTLRFLLDKLGFMDELRKVSFVSNGELPPSKSKILPPPWRREAIVWQPSFCRREALQNLIIYLYSY